MTFSMSDDWDTRLLDIDEVALTLGIETSEVLTIIVAGGLPLIRLCTGDIRIALVDLREFIRQHRCGEEVCCGTCC